MSVTNKYPFLETLHKSRKKVKKLSKTITNSIKDLDNINCTYLTYINDLKGMTTLVSNNNKPNIKSKFCNAISKYMQKQQQLSNDIGKDFEETFNTLMKNFKTNYNSTFLDFDIEIKSISKRIERVFHDFKVSDRTISEIETKFESRKDVDDNQDKAGYFVGLARRATDERMKLLKLEKVTNDISKELQTTNEKVDCVFNDLEKLKKSIDKKCALNLLMFEMNLHKSQVHELNNLYDELKSTK